MLLDPPVYWQAYFAYKIHLFWLNLITSRQAKEMRGENTCGEECEVLCLHASGSNYTVDLPSLLIGKCDIWDLAELKLSEKASVTRWMFWQDCLIVAIRLMIKGKRMLCAVAKTVLVLDLNLEY